MDADSTSVTIVNIVASGRLGLELDLDSLYQDIDAGEKQYEPETHSGIHLRFQEEGPLITLYSSGSYVIMGAKSKEAVNRVYNQLTDSLKNLDISIRNTSPEVQNLICKAELNRELNLSALVVALGSENVEYEPEQSPFLYYRPNEFDCLVSIPANGKIVITGVTDVQEVEDIYQFVQNKINF